MLGEGKSRQGTHVLGGEEDEALIKIGANAASRGRSFISRALHCGVFVCFPFFLCVPEVQY